jgi:hypothetical protein
MWGQIWGVQTKSDGWKTMVENVDLKLAGEALDTSHIRKERVHNLSSHFYVSLNSNRLSLNV